MKKFFIFAAAVMALTAAMADPGLFSNDRAAVEAAVNNNKTLPWKRLGYLVRLADMDDPEAAKTFDGYMALIERVGQDNGFSKALIDDAKMYLPFLRRSFGNEAYMLAKKMGHPYELRYMVNPKAAAGKAVNKAYPTPAARHKAALALMNRHFKTYGAWGSPSDMRSAVTYIFNSGKAGKVATMAKDLQALKKRIQTTKHSAPQSFNGVPELIDKYIASLPAAPKPAAGGDPGLFSNNRAAVEAAVNNKKILPWKRLGYLVRLADMDDPEAAKTFEGYMALIEQVGQDNGYSRAQIDDAKMFLPFTRRSFGNEAYMLAKKMGHPYELRYMVNPKAAAGKAVNKAYPTPAARYKAALALMNRHFKTYGAWGSPSDMRSAVTYIFNNGKAGKVATMAKDLQALKKRIQTTKHSAPTSFNGVPELIDKYVGTQNTGGPKDSSYSAQWSFIRGEVKKLSRKNPQLLRDYAVFTEFCEKTAAKYDFQARVLADAKCAIPYFYGGPMLKDAMIYTMEVEHPYEIRYLTDTRNAKNVASVLTTPKERYDRVIYLLKKHTARYSEWNAPDIIIGAVKYLKNCADSDTEITSLAEDCNQLKLIFAPYAAQRPKAWKPVIKQLNAYTL